MQELLKRYNLYHNTLLFIYNTSILLRRLFVTYLSFLDVFLPLLPPVLEDVEYGMSLSDLIFMIKLYKAFLYFCYLQIISLSLQFL